MGKSGVMAKRKGNHILEEILNKIIKSKKISHSYILNEISKDFIKAILCVEENKPCGICGSCVRLERR